MSPGDHDRGAHAIPVTISTFAPCFGLRHLTPPTPGGFVAEGKAFG